jgi:hypothetical protein
MLDQDIIPELPECIAHYLLEYFFDVGPTIDDGHLTYAEISAWQQTMGLVLTPWETQQLHQLSRVYIDQAHKSRAFDCPAPYSDEVVEQQQRELVENKFRQFLSNSRVTRG